MNEVELANLERLKHAVESAFEVPDETTQIAAQELTFASQAELDAHIHHLRRCKIPGLKHIVAEAIIFGDEERLATVAQTAREQAIIGIELRMCRKAVSGLIAANRKQK